MKKKMVSMLLALTLVVTGIPSGMAADTAYAAEISEDRVVISGEAEESDGIIENNAVSGQALHSEAGDLYTFNVSENGKAVGSDGVVYDDVVYLSAENVKALSADAQDAYFEFCDDVAAARNAGDCFNDAVAAVDENGTLIFYYTIPIKEIAAAMDELSEELMETVENQGETQTDETVLQEEDTVETQTTEETVEETVVDTDLAEELSTEESTVGQTTAEEEIETVTDESNVEETTTEELLTEETLASETVEEESTAKETVTEELSTEETETAIEQYELSAENMEFISEPEAEEFPEIESVKADLIMDLGYESSDIQQLNSILPLSDWFSSQLTKNQKTIYNACKGMLKGTNQFKFNATSKLTYEDFCQAISAYIMTYPYQCDWMDLGSIAEKKYLTVEAWYYSKSDPTYDFVVTIAKSPYYNSSLVKSANAKVLELAAEGQIYAIENHADSPVYGIVEYFDKWICENNFYNNIGVTGGSSKDKNTQEIYYYCHSSYGILLKGSGVCESYALTMSRLLDAIGIPNMYATGQALDENGKPAGGHAWNYIQMPNGKWYLQDSTWNDGGDKSSEDWLLCGDDGQHYPMGNRYSAMTDEFIFVPCSASDYKPEKERITLSAAEIDLLPKGIAELSCNSEYIANENIPKVWSSSDEKVAKVDKNGKVTAVGAGTAEITLTAAGMSDTCTVNVHQIKSITFKNGGKASLTTSCGIESGSGSKETQHILLAVDQGVENPKYTAEELYQKGVFDDFAVKSSNESVATVLNTTKLTENEIDLAIQPKTMGKTKVTITFGTKKATLNLSISEKLNENWFDFTEVKKLQKDGKDGKLMYTGKAYKPKVVLTGEGKAKKVKFKVSYLNNKDAGTASVIVTGTGTYGGELREDFIINPQKLNVGTIKVSKSNVYNGGINLTKSTVKHIDESGSKPKAVSLKAGKDYDILYTKNNGVSTTQPTEVGVYTMSIVGKGNYAGGDNKPVKIGGKTWEITQNDIKKVKVSVKVNGTTPTVTVAIGKNVLPETDYKMTFYKDKGCEKKADLFVAKTQYFVMVEAKGSNITMSTKSKPIVKSFKTK